MNALQHYTLCVNSIVVVFSLVVRGGSRIYDLTQVKHVALTFHTSDISDLRSLYMPFKADRSLVYDLGGLQIVPRGKNRMA